MLSVASSVKKHMPSSRQSGGADERKLQQAHELIKQGKFEEAGKIYQKLVNKTKHPEAEVLFGLGLVYRGWDKQKDDLKAYGYMKQAADKKYPLAMYLLGLMLKRE